MTAAASESALLAWSSGKESAMALYELQRGGYEVLALLTVLTEDYDRVSMHGVRRALLERQAASLGLPLSQVVIAKDSSMEDYEAAMRRTLEHYAALGVSSVAFGDVSLEDLRRHREGKLAQVGMKAVFPIWKRDTAELARSFLDLGFKAVITCVDSRVLDKAFVGRDFDERFLRDLPDGVDPCGENGEFHSFVYDGPVFAEEVPHDTGQVVLRDNRFWFCDLLPVQ